MLAAFFIVTAYLGLAAFGSEAMDPPPKPVSAMRNPPPRPVLPASLATPATEEILAQGAQR